MCLKWFPLATSGEKVNAGDVRLMFFNKCTTVIAEKSNKNLNNETLQWVQNLDLNINIIWTLGKQM